MLAAPALADGDDDAPPSETPPEDVGDFWERTADPGRAEFERAYREGVRLLDPARGEGRGASTAAREAAEAAFRRAIAASPKRPDGWFGLARTIDDVPGREEDAVSAYGKARELAPPDWDSGAEIAMGLGVLFSKLGRFEESVDEYEHVFRARMSDRGRSVALANSAEALMALGRLSEAIERYRRAAEAAPGDAEAQVGARWGLCVALDRDEQIAKAAEIARQALAVDSQIAYFGRANVFFVPEGDEHYYRALAHEHAGHPDTSIDHWRRFLERLPASPWAYRAKQHLAALEAADKVDKAAKAAARAGRKKPREEDAARPSPVRPRLLHAPNAP